jgi:3-deoxy-7-phosphoheptulonate synthase
MNTAWRLELQDLQEAQHADLQIRCQKEKLNFLSGEKLAQASILGPKEKLLHLLENAQISALVKSLQACEGHYPHQMALKKGYHFKVNKEVITQGALTLVAGPCAAESFEQLDAVGAALNAHGISLIRAGLFKPRSSPYAFQGHGSEAFEWTRAIKEKWGLGLVSEVLDPAHLEAASDLIDIVQIGSRNMHNSCLLKEVAAMHKPVLLKRGFSATYHEWLLAGEYLLHHGARQVIFCERGIRTFENLTRFTLDINAVAVMKELSPLPLWIDPSHATGQRRWVLPAAKAAVAAGADGLLIEVHPNPSKALSDSEQTLGLEALEDIANLKKLKAFIQAAD